MKAIKRAIILCWIMLIMCFVIKLVGGNWFDIICTNEHFIKICSYIDNHLILSDIIGVIIYVIVGYFVFKAMSNVLKTNIQQKLYIVLCLAFIWSFTLWNTIIKLIVELFGFIISPYIINILNKETKPNALKRTWYRGILGYVLILVFQLISLLTKNVGIKITDDSFLITNILFIDYYIMATLYCLYIKMKIKTKKEDKSNG